jgi:hypothetical protein
MWLGILDEIDGMDQMNLDLMMRSGVTLEGLTAKSRDEELRAQEVSRMKVEDTSAPEKSDGVKNI